VTDRSLAPANAGAAIQKKLLIVHAHPAPHVSRANRAFLAVAQTLPFVTLHEIYDDYPGMFIDVRREQALLLAHDIIVLQHPLYWYSVPALLKEWIDLVLEYGWAYGPHGEQLAGKIWCHAISTGGADDTYHVDGSNRFPLDSYLLPLEQTARLCGMAWQPPFVAHAARALDDAALTAEAQRYLAWLNELRSSR
jgi:glutathione-regulated potassium-efflux system ancillary protein KefG